MTLREDAPALIAELKHAATLYYQEAEESPLTDEEFDAKRDLLATYALSPEVADLFAPGTEGWKLLENDVSLGTTPSATAPVVNHRTKMFSLGKITKEEELEAFLKKVRAQGAKGFRLQAKLDGLALSATYRQGKLALLATRGTGTQGEDVTYLATAAQATVLGLPTTVPLLEDFEVRGELYFTREQFAAVDAARQALGADPFKNSRNACTGLLKKAKLGVDYPVEFTYTAYIFLKGDELQELSTLPEGFTTVDAATQAAAPHLKLSGFKDDQELFEAVRKFGKARSALSLPTDGAVVKPTNEAEMQAKMGSNSHHPLSQVAYKYPGETADTVVLSVGVTVGKTGKLTPVARVEPAMVDGSMLENITMNNYNWVAEKDVRVGSHVRIHKANDIIPEIHLVLQNPADSVPVAVPTVCPECEGALRSVKEEAGVFPPKTLLCTNDSCPSRDFFALKTAVSKTYLDIDGLAEATLTTLHESGRVTTVADLFTLSLEELADSTMGYSAKGSPRRLGKARAQNILKHLELAKTLPFYRQLMALNIPSFGPANSRALVKKFKTLPALQAATVEEVEALEGFGEILATRVVEGLKSRGPLIRKLQEAGMTFQDEEEAGGSSLQGLSFAISGAVPQPFANRGAWVEFIESEGGSFHSSPKASTSFMVGDPQDTSSKVVKAVALRLAFLTPEEFTARYTK